MDIWFGDPGEDLVPGLVHGRLHGGRHRGAQLETFAAQGQQPGIGRWDLQSVGAQVKQLAGRALVAADGWAAGAGLDALPLHRLPLFGCSVDEQHAIAVARKAFGANPTGDGAAGNPRAAAFGYAELREDDDLDAETRLDIVRRMADAGHAWLVMGNHEFNAIAYANKIKILTGALQQFITHKTTNEVARHIQSLCTITYDL